MAQESQIERPKPSAHPPFQDNHLNVQAIENALAEGLAKVPIVKKVLCSNEGCIFNLIIVHNSPSTWIAVDTIVDRIIDIEEQVTQSGDAPEDVYFGHRLYHESTDRQHEEWGEKTLFERK